MEGKGMTESHIKKTMSQLPAHLNGNLAPKFQELRLSRPYTLLKGVDTMTGYPPAETVDESGWSAHENDPQDPVSGLEHDDAPEVDLDGAPQVVIPLPVLDNPEGEADLRPDLAGVESRPPSPLIKMGASGPNPGPPKNEARLPVPVGDGPPDAPTDGGPPVAGPSGAPRSWGSESSSDDGRSTIVGPKEAGPSGSMVPGPLKIDPKARERFRKRLVTALELVTDESKPLTISSLQTIVDEITELDQRLDLLERQLNADRESTRYLITTQAKSESAASEARIRRDLIDLRTQVDMWRGQVRPTAAPAQIQPAVEGPRDPAVPARARAVKKGFKLG